MAAMRTTTLSDLLPGWRTDLILHRHGSLLTERDDCIVVRTPGNPTFYWGNFLLLPAAPADAELAHWQARFAQEIGSLQPESRHLAFGINAAPAGEALPAWQAAGFERIETSVLQLHPGRLQAPPRLARGEVRFAQVDLERDLEAVVALQCAEDQGFEPAGYATFRRRQMQRYAAMARAGDAAWFGVWCDGVLAADCGLIRDAALGRFQHVSTHPGYRRRGLCSLLVNAVSAWGFEHWRLAETVMCADPHDVAIGIYETLGYRCIGQEWGLQLRSPQDRAGAAA